MKVVNNKLWHSICYILSVRLKKLTTFLILTIQTLNKNLTKTRSFLMVNLSKAYTRSLREVLYWELQ